MTRAELVKARCIICVGRTFALVDPEDYDLARMQTWKLGKAGNGRLYAYCFVKNAEGFQKWYLHHLVALRARGPREGGKEMVCVADNGDTLDCRRANLRWRNRMAVKLEAMRKGREKAAANA